MKGLYKMNSGAIAFSISHNSCAIRSLRQLLSRDLATSGAQARPPEASRTFFMLLYHNPAGAKRAQRGQLTNTDVGLTIHELLSEDALGSSPIIR